jgi:hypothetical protein
MSGNIARHQVRRGVMHSTSPDLFGGFREASMGELLFHPAFRPAITEAQLPCVGELLDAMDRAIAAIEKSAVVACSPNLEAAARVCRATRESLAAVDQRIFASSPAGLDLLMTFMQEVRALLLLVRDSLLNGKASP